MNAHETHMNSSALNGNILSTQRIHTTALGVFLHNDRIFVAECYDPNKGERFYSPLGGGIEFGAGALPLYPDGFMALLLEQSKLETKA